MKRTVEFGLLRFFLTFIVIDVNSWKNTQYQIDKVEDVEHGEQSLYELTGTQPSLLDHFEAYLEAILPALANGTEPQTKPPADYSYRSAADKAAAIYDESEQYVPRRTVDSVQPVRKGNYNPFDVRSHTSTWQGDISLISTTF